MRRFFLIILLAFILFAGCAALPPADDANPPVAQAGLKKPRIPKPMELAASILNAGSQGKNESADDMKKVLDEIDKELSRPNITKEDIQRGWYVGSKEEKKYGTPDGWVFMQMNGENRWVSPNILEESDDAENKQLCKETAGTYVFSCYESDKADCEYIAKSECRCIDGSRWHEKQGCILMDADGNYVPISSGDLQKGWYRGLSDQKKLNTPINWIWQDIGEDSRWKNPSPK